MPKHASARPEHAPEGHEWIVDAYQRDVEPNGDKARELVRAELAEGRISATLRTPYGDRHTIDVRMWDKERLDQKVHPRFEDGWIRMRQELGHGRYIEGWVFIPVGAFKAAIDRSSRRLTVSAEKKCQDWLEDLMSGGSEPERIKASYRAEAKDKFSIGERAFDRAWSNAITNSGNTNWSKPGRKS